MGSESFSQPSSRSPLAPPANGPRKSEPGDGYVALIGAMIHVMPGETIEKGTVVMRGGVIESVASGENVPAGAESRDCAGMHIYAGFVEPYFEVEVPKPDPNAPGSHWNSHVTPQRNALDKGAGGITSKDADALRSMGFVAAAISPKGGIFRGSSALVSLAQGSSDPSDAQPKVYVDHVYQCVSLETSREDSGDGPPMPGAGRQQRPTEDAHWTRYPDSQMGSIALVRQTLSDADWTHERNIAVGRTGEAVTHDSLDAVSWRFNNFNMPPNPLGSSQAEEDSRRNRRAFGVLLFDCADELEVLRTITIAEEFNRLCQVLGSGLEFRRLEAITQAAGKSVRFIEPLNFPRTPKVGTVGEQEGVELRELENWEQAPTNLRRMDAAGLTVALTTSKIPERNGGRKVFREHLGQAIKAGLKPEKALAMVTTNAAAVLGVGDRFGTVEKGKVASVIVADGDLFTDKLDAPKKGEAGYVRAGRIIDVWIDGRRHVIAGKQRRDLGGTWEVTMEPGPKAGSNVRITYEIDDEFPPAITIIKRSTDDAGKEQKATTKATGVSIEEDGRFRFSFDHEPFGEKGVFVSAGVIEKGKDGSPVMRAEAIRAAGQMFHWTAKRVSTELPKPEKRAPRGGRRGGVGGGPTDGEKKDDAQPGEGVKPDAGEKKDDKPAAKPGETTKEKDSAGAEPPVAAKNEDKKEPEKKDVAAKDDAADVKKDEPKKSKTPEADALATIPEKLGLPLGPYALDEPAKAETLVITGGTIWTSGPGGVIENGVMVIADGKVSAIGKAGSVTIPTGDNVRTIDATGKHITPGIIDCHSHTGISRGVNESGQAVTAEVRIGDVMDPDSISWYRQLGGGVTCVNNLHGSANPIGGQNQVNKVRWGCIAPEDMHFAGAIPGIKFALGENVKQSNGDRASTRYPVTRMGVETLLRDRFTAAREYQKALKDEADRMSVWEKEHPDLARGLTDKGEARRLESSKAPRRDLELEALAEILEGKRLIHCHSYRQDEILMLCRIADEFNFKIGTFQHGLEVYKVADIVKTHAIGASLFSDWWAYKVEVQDAIPYAGPMQTEVGVLTSYNSDSDEMARRLNVEAGKAAKYSHGHITPAEALKFVTLNPAKQLKIDAKVGSLEVGKDADIAVWSGPPLSSLSRCERTFVDGRELFSLEKDAAMRQKNAAERARIIQKVLAAGSGGGRGPRGPRGEGDAEGGNPDAGKPTEEVAMDDQALVLAARRSVMLEMYRQQDDQLRERYLNMLMRGLDPRFHTAGECGCLGN